MIGTVCRALPLAVTAAAALGLAAPSLAQTADDYRGGWRTDAGDPNVYQFVITGTQVTGVYCTHCSDGTTLARIEGRFDPEEGIDFAILHFDADGSLQSEDSAQGRLVGGQLLISGSRGGDDGEVFEHVVIKDPRGPARGRKPQVMLLPNSPPVSLPALAGSGPPATQPAYVQAAPWRQLTPDDLAGVWLGFSIGLTKQYFVIRKAGDELYGVACGPCDNPYTMGSLENFRIHGDTVEFDIEHQDWGEGSKVPFARHVIARIGMNEMRIDARRDDLPGEPPIVASLLGPIAIEATRGNVIAAQP